ncbi:MAG: DNA gyrase inhibitor YacG [Gammaproteobacteria bacterium]
MKDNIKCPQCGKPTSLSSGNHWRPFCSERCRLIDLGDWIDGNYRISSDDSINIPPVSEDIQTKH